MMTNIAGQAAALSEETVAMVSPFVDHTIPFDERRIDLDARHRPIRELWQLHERHMEETGEVLSPASRQTLMTGCALLQVVAHVNVVEELQDFLVMMVLDYMAERGFCPRAQRVMMRGIFEMLFTTLIKSDEYDVELRQKLDDCTGTAWVCVDMALETRREPGKLATPLTGGEIQALLSEAYSVTTAHLATGFSQCTAWFLVLMLVSGLPANRLFKAKVGDVYADEASVWLRNGGEAVKLPPIVKDLGLGGYLDGLDYRSEVKLFPALAKAAGRHTLHRVLAGRRVEAACGRPGGYTLQDILQTCEDQSLVVAALSAWHTEWGFLQ